MKIRFLIVLVFFIYNFLPLNSSVKAQDLKSALSKINFICRECTYEQTEKGYNFDVSDISGDYKVVITHKEYSSIIKVFQKKKNIMNMSIDGYIMNIGTVDLNNNFKYVLIVTIQGASGILTTMTMIDINNKNSVFLSFGNPYWSIPQIDRSDNFYLNKNKDVSDFLEVIKYEFGYFDNELLISNENNPVYMYENWLRINDRTDFGRISFVKYSGTYQTDGTVNDELYIKNKKYIAYFKGGVIVNDFDNNEYFVLYAPHDYYCWPNVLKKYKDYLFIGTRGEGLAVINLEKNILKRIDLGKDFSDVESIIINNGQIVINKYKQINFTEF